mgnify:FL=1
MIMQKEDKIIKSSENILNEAKTKTDKTLVPEYEILLTEYKKLDNS